MPGQDANMDMDPSDISDLDDKDTLIAEQKPDAAASSPAPDETDAELLSVARSAIDAERAKSEPVSSAETVVDDPDGSDEQKKQDDVDYTDVPFHKHPRFQKVLRTAKENERGAALYRNVENFMVQHGLDDGEAAEALTVAGLAKTNPVAAWERIKPWVQKILVAAGEVLPDDLRQRVQSGEMSQDVAVELSRTRAAQQSVTASQQFEQRRREQQATTDTHRSIMDAAQQWEDDRKLKDPNYADKAKAVEKEVLYLQRVEGVPNTPQGVRAQLKKAYDEVNKGFRPTPVVAQRTAVRPVVGGQVSGNRASAAPQNTLDIIRAARGA